jgi:hypothetical protein
MINNFLYKLEILLRARFETPINYKPNHILLASFPKAGNTYMRFILSSIYKQISDDTVQVDFYGISYYTPEIRGNRNLQNTVNPNSNSFPVFLKTHFANNSQFNKYKRVLIKRDVVKTLASYKQYLEGEHGYEFKSNMHFIKHWRYGVSAYCNFYNSWNNKADYVMEYENLIKEPAREIKQLMVHLNLDITVDVIEKAIEVSSRENMDRLRKLKGDPFGKNANYKFVSDKQNERKVIFTGDEINFIIKYTEQKLR